jgi:N-acetylmuramoyl-L-alanine amidase
MFILTYPLVVLADTLVVAGRPHTLEAPFIVEGDDVLAPLTPALRYLGVQSTADGNKLTLETATQQSIALTLNSPNATINGKRTKLPVAPRQVDGLVYLPLRALARWMNAEAQYDADARVLALHPLVSITYEARDDGLAVLVRSSAPLQYTSGRAADPPRYFIDFKHAALGLLEQEIPVGVGQVARLRLSQYSLQPSVVRLVADLNDDAGVRTTVSEQGRLVTITISEMQPESPLPPLEQYMPQEQPARLINVQMTPRSHEQTELLVTADGALTVISDFDARACQLVLRFPNGLNVLPAACLGTQTDKNIQRLEATGSVQEPGAMLVIGLKREVGYLIDRLPSGIRVLLGTFSIRDMTIVLDAGHGGHDTGAIGPNGTLEKEMNLDIIRRTEKILAQLGARVLLTRGNDVFIPLDDRPGLANTRKADLFISVHCNSSPRRNSSSGTQTYYRTPQSASFAAAMHTELVRALGLKNGGVRTANFLVIRKSLMPAILLEIAYLNNDEEEALLRSPAFRQKAAEAIVNGIRRYAASSAWQLRRSDLATMVIATDDGIPTMPADAASALSP